MAFKRIVFFVTAIVWGCFALANVDSVTFEMYTFPLSYEQGSMRLLEDGEGFVIRTSKNELFSVAKVDCGDNIIEISNKEKYSVGSVFQKYLTGQKLPKDNLIMTELVASFAPVDKLELEGF
ncbi:MAG: hypothetical protein ACJAT7_002771, partial [Psychromonas sp.]|uniref:hypothetical protein n=1 Tax=Psychromonas sp. TaxID=1884585 RepID=UPI0039E4F0B2